MERAERQRRAAQTQRQRDKERAEARKLRGEGAEVAGRSPVDWDTVGDAAGKVGDALSEVFGGNKSAEYVAGETPTNKGLWILGGVGAVGAVVAVGMLASKPAKRGKR